MLKRPERTFAILGYWKPVVVGAVGLCVAIVVSYYLAAPEFGGPMTAPEASYSDGVGNSSAAKPGDSPNSLASRAEPSLSRIESNQNATLVLNPLSPDDRAVDERHDLPGLSAKSVEEVKLLHAQQQADVELMLGDLDAIVIDSGNGAAITVQEMRFLHEQQQRELESAYDGEVVIPASSASPALTVAELRALHERQEKASR